MINWKTIKEFEDITFKMANGVARIAFNRPEVRNAFRPKTVDELTIKGKESFEGRSGPAKRTNSAPELKPNCAKNQPETYYENGPERNIVNVGAVVAPQFVK